MIFKSKEIWLLTLSRSILCTISGGGSQLNRNLLINTDPVLENFKGASQPEGKFKIYSTKIAEVQMSFIKSGYLV